MLHRCQPALFALALVFAAPTLAAELTPVGTWTTIDDTTNKPKSIVQINEVDGKLLGKVVEVLQSDEGPHPLCKKCEGDRKDQPVEGMTIIWGVTKDGDVWDGGKILDPKTGKIYKVQTQPHRQRPEARCARLYRLRVTGPLADVGTQVAVIVAVRAQGALLRNSDRRRSPPCGRPLHRKSPCHNSALQQPSGNCDA